MKRVLVMALCFALLAGAAVAGEHRRPPQAVFKQQEARQRGLVGAFCWSWTNEDGSGGGMCNAVAGYRWPKSEPATGGRAARITLKWPEVPDRVKLQYWRRIDRDEGNQPVGEPTVIETTIVPRATESGRVWDIHFDVPGNSRHVYMEAWVRWPQGDPFYYFHLRAE